MFSMLLLSVLAAAPADAPARVRVLVLDLKPSGGVEPSVVENITGLSAAILSEDKRLEVLAGPDLRQLVDLQSQKSSLGCDADSASCIAELAGALDAKLVVIGNVGYIGSTLNVNLVLFDQAKGQNAGRRAVQAKEVGELSTSLRAPLHSLINDVLGAPAGGEGASGPSLGLIALIGGSASAAVGVVLLGVSAYPTFAINGEQDKFVAGDQAALDNAIKLQTDWFDSNLATGLAIGGGALVVVGAGAIVAGVVMGAE